MKKLTSSERIEKIISCVLLDGNNEMAWCVYHPDDGQEKLIFTKNENDCTHIENFEKYRLVEIIEHLNTYGFEIESKEDFEDILTFNNLPENFTVKLIEVELKSHLIATFKF